MPAEVRLIRASEVDGWVQCMGVGFLTAVPDGEADYRRPEMDLDRSWGAFDGGRVVGTLRSFPTTLTVPGPSAVTASAVTNVTVAPTDRRRGLLRQMMHRDLSADRGEAVSILIASEYPLYGRFGFGAAADSATYRVTTTGARFKVPGEGAVAFVDQTGLRAAAPGVYDRFRADQPGAILRSERWWDRTLQRIPYPGSEPWKGYQVLYRDAVGETQGYARYGATPRWDQMRPDSELTVHELVALTPSAYRGLWGFLCDVDLVTSVVAADRPVEELLPWLLEDARMVRQVGRADFLWVRIIDTAAALSGRRYSLEGHVTLDVDDPTGLASGRYELDGGPEGATCTPTERPADLTMSVEALGSAYLGGVGLRTLADAGRLHEHRPGALALADGMFRSPVVPWCSTWF